MTTRDTRFTVGSEDNNIAKIYCPQDLQPHIKQQIDTNRAAERCRSEQILHQPHLKHREKIRGNLPQPRNHLSRQTEGAGEELKDCRAVSQLVALQLLGDGRLLVHFC